MGCSGSKSTETSPQGGQDSPKKERPETISKKDAVKELMAAGVEKSRAERLVTLADTDGDGKFQTKVLDKVKADIDKLKSDMSKLEIENDTISQDDASKLMTDRFPKLPPEVVAYMVSECDKQKNKRIDAKELATVMVYTANVKTVILRRFKEVDKDNDGTLQRTELRSIMMKELDIKEVEADMIIDVYDKNRDDVLSQQEFITMWAEMVG